MVKAVFKCSQFGNFNKNNIFVCEDISKIDTTGFLGAKP